MTYGGDVSVEDTYQAIKDDPDAVLVDVRTRPELQYVGFPDLSEAGKQLVAIEWQTYPHGEVNTSFVEDLRRAGITEDHTVYFLCRSGARSRAAAILATGAGYDNAYNIDQGFEGAPDAHGHRGTTGGWKAAGLPWRQG